MATTATYRQAGDVLDYLNETTDVIGDGTILTIGKRIGVAGCTIAPGAIGSAHVTGVFRLPKGSDAIKQGDELFWDGEKVAASGDVAAGYAFETAGADAETVAVKINA